MEVIKKAIGTVYEFTCPHCGSLLRAKPEELVQKKVSGLYSFMCPVENKERLIGSSAISKETVYEW